MTTTPLPRTSVQVRLAHANNTISALEQARADLEAEVKRLKQAAEELSFLYGDLLLWTERAVDKGNANSDIEEAWARYEEWLQARTALKETP